MEKIIEFDYVCLRAKMGIALFDAVEQAVKYAVLNKRKVKLNFGCDSYWIDPGNIIGTIIEANKIYGSKLELRGIDG